MEKKLYLFEEDGEKISILLTEEQAAVIYWLIEDRDYEFKLTKMDDFKPIEITADKWGES